MRISPAALLPTKHGIFSIRAVCEENGLQHVIVFKGHLDGAESVPVRIHSECLTSEVLNSLRCDCNEQLESALNLFEAEGHGVLIYLRQEGRGIGLFNKILAYALQDTGMDTVEANVHLGLPVDSRTYKVAAEIIRFLGIKSIRLLTNNPLKTDSLHELGIIITENVPVHVKPNAVNFRYIETKKKKLHHHIA